MAATPYADSLTRPWWAGEDADLSIHIEAYEGDIDGSFRVESLFRTGGLTNFKSVENQSNTWRGDRIGGATVKGRRSGETLDPERIVNDKYTITVDATSYVRTPVDYQDDWTAPDRKSEISYEHATAHAKVFDTAHITALIKAGQWVAPAALTNFNNGITDDITGWETNPPDKAGRAENADRFVQTHKLVLEEFVNRDLGGSLAEFVTLVKPAIFSTLLDHDKLMSVEFQAPSGGNNFVQRRVGYVNGCRVIETPRFPTAGDTTTVGHVANVLGPWFTVSADEARTAAIVFHPKQTLITVEAKGMTVRVWDDPKDFNWVLDSYHMYTVGIRRGDATAVLRLPA